jgi:hypothetical protein
MRVKEAVEEHLFCRALVDSSQDRCTNENLEEELGPELTAFSSK